MSQSLKIAAWNVNSVRMRMPNVIAWLNKEAPDILLLQELKCTSDDFPMMEFLAAGYKCTVVGQKAYNGVALLSKYPVEDVKTALPGDTSDTQARYVEATCCGMRVASVYAPNGNPVDSEKYSYKLQWMERLNKHLQQMLKAGTPFVVGGDFNVIPEAVDVYNPKDWEGDALYKLETRKAFRTILNLGITEAFRTLHPNKQAYTFWDYKAGAWERDYGLRIDHFLLSPQTADRLLECHIDSEQRGKDNASDHAPVIVTVE